MKIFVFICSIAVLIAGGCIAGGTSSFRSSYDFNSVEKIAIVAIEGSVKSETAKDQIADFFAMELLDNGFSPIGRAQVRAALRDQNIEAASLSSVEAATEVGAILKVPVVMVIEIPRFEEKLTMTAKLIDVEDGSIIWMGKSSGRAGQTVSGTLMGVFTGSGGTSRSSEYDLNSGPIAELFGGEVNPALSPDEEQKIQRIVKSICSSLPIRSTMSW
ncbi:MAG: hypothetical protein JW715_01650 [Sedimentisphaerales bacterium]|nr:hypothetical protein [Sedimentisphaerales bacterium]